MSQRSLSKYDQWMAEPVSLSDAKRRVLDALKRADALTTPALARTLGLTEAAVRQHLQALESQGLVERASGTARGRGRPAVRWSLSALAQELFPDRHADLTLELIDAVRESAGDEGLSAVVAARSARQARVYGEEVAKVRSLRGRVEALAAMRTREGYMAEVQPAGRGCYLLVEHHCPICDAASACTGLCASELEVFQSALGEGVEVERVEHLLSGGQRCVYRVRAEGGSG